MKIKHLTLGISNRLNDIIQDTWSDIYNNEEQLDNYAHNLFDLAVWQSLASEADKRKKKLIAETKDTFKAGLADAPIGDEHILHQGTLSLIVKTKNPVTSVNAKAILSLLQRKYGFTPEQVEEIREHCSSVNAAARTFEVV